MDVRAFWKAVLQQNADKIRPYFKETAYVNWHCTNEHFTVDEFIQANCEYPGQWDGVVERIEERGNVTITVTRVYTADRRLSFHVVSFIQTEGGQIVSIDEYWGDDGIAPQWRLEKHLGSPIC